VSFFVANSSHDKRAWQKSLSVGSPSLPRQKKMFLVGSLIESCSPFQEKIVPSNILYEHDKRWGDGNGFSQMDQRRSSNKLANLPCLLQSVTETPQYHRICVNFRKLSFCATLHGSMKAEVMLTSEIPAIASMQALKKS
jgi:hypothetical protein